MPGTYPTARAAIQSALNGLTIDLGAAYKTETLVALEFPPGGQVAASSYPVAFPLPSVVQIGRGPTNWREWLMPDYTIRIVLAPRTEFNANLLAQRRDAWMVALADAWDAHAALDGTADISIQQEFSPLLLFDDVDQGWGFDMLLGDVRITEVKTFSA